MRSCRAVPNVVFGITRAVPHHPHQKLDFHARWPWAALGSVLGPPSVKGIVD
jgi:hypothetical protein